MNDLKYSVLMSVYYKEKPENLRESIDSMLKQTLRPDEIVLVKDGQLTQELETVIQNYQETYDDMIKIVELKDNVGLGLALREGLLHCKNEFVARMDTDDVAVETRCEKQINRFSQNPHLGVVGSSIAEFLSSPSNVVAFKLTKETHEEIAKQMKFRNPINHPTVMFKKSSVLAAGNYLDWPLNEDYYLWIRMLLKGFLFENIKEPLVNMRITNDTYQRRGGWKYYKTQQKLFLYMKENGLISFFDYYYNNSIRFIARVMLPNTMRRWLYQKILRN